LELNHLNLSELQ